MTKIVIPDELLTPAGAQECIEQQQKLITYLLGTCNKWRKAVLLLWVALVISMTVNILYISGLANAWW